MTKTTLNMVPDKSLIIKLGQKNYKIQEALAELVDNSIDEKLPNEKLVIDIKLDIKEEKNEDSEITIEDNGNGMDEQTFKDAAILGKSSKQSKLGFYGLGMKTACMNLAKKYTVSSSKKGIAEMYTFDFDEDNWLSDKELDWFNYPYEKEFEDKNEHYTKISLKKLKISKNINPRRLRNRIIDDFSFRYGMLIENGEIIIRVNSQMVSPNLPECEKETKVDFDFLLDENDKASRIHGWVGLNWDSVAQKTVSSQIGKYGFLSFRNRRLITAWDDLKIDKEIFAIRRHPQWASVIGVVNMDFIPVENDKRNFIQENPLYVETVKRLRPYVKQIEEVIKNREGKSEMAEDITEFTEELTRAAEESLNEKDIRELVAQTADEDGIENYNRIVKKSVSGRLIRGDKLVEGDKEYRERVNKIIGFVNPNDKPKIRVPVEKTTKGKVKQIEEIEDSEGLMDITLEDKAIKVKHSYVDHIEGDALRAWDFVDDSFIVKTNIAPIFDMTGKEYPTFALHNICESLAEFTLSTQDNGKIVEMRDNLIKKVYKIISNLSISR